MVNSLSDDGWGEDPVSRASSIVGLVLRNPSRPPSINNTIGVAYQPRHNQVAATSGSNAGFQQVNIPVVPSASETRPVAAIQSLGFGPTNNQPTANTVLNGSNANFQQFDTPVMPSGQTHPPAIQNASFGPSADQFMVPATNGFNVFQQGNTPVVASGQTHPTAMENLAFGPAGYHPSFQQETNNAPAVASTNNPVFFNNASMVFQPRNNTVPVINGPNTNFQQVHTPVIPSVDTRPLPPTQSIGFGPSGYGSVQQNTTRVSAAAPTLARRILENGFGVYEPINASVPVANGSNVALQSVSDSLANTHIVPPSETRPPVSIGFGAAGYQQSNNPAPPQGGSNIDFQSNSAHQGTTNSAPIVASTLAPIPSNNGFSSFAPSSDPAPAPQVRGFNVGFESTNAHQVDAPAVTPGSFHHNSGPVHPAAPQVITGFRFEANAPTNAPSGIQLKKKSAHPRSYSKTSSSSNEVPDQRGNPTSTPSGGANGTLRNNRGNSEVRSLYNSSHAASEALRSDRSSTNADRLSELRDFHGNNTIRTSTTDTTLTTNSNGQFRHQEEVQQPEVKFTHVDPKLARERAIINKGFGFINTTLAAPSDQIRDERPIVVHCEPSAGVREAAESVDSHSSNEEDHRYPGFGVQRTDPTRQMVTGSVGSSSDTGSHNIPIIAGPRGGLGFGKPSTAVELASHLATQGKAGGGAQGPPVVSYIPVKARLEDLWQERIKPGKLFDDFFKCPTDTTGGGLEDMRQMEYLLSFNDLPLTEAIRNNIINRCEYERPTPVQQCTIKKIINGDDVMVCAQTGCGKTAAYLLPVLSKLIQQADLASSQDKVCSPRCIVLVPTRELAIQIYCEGRKFSYSTSLEVKSIYGGTSVAYQKKDIAERTTVLVATTGRLIHFLNDGAISLEKLKFLVIDEADRMLDMGFGPEIDRLMAHETMPEVRQTMMFSATFPTSVQLVAQAYLRTNYTMVTVDKIGSANKCITQAVIDCDRSQKRDLLFQYLNIDLETYTADKEADIFKKKTLIFVSKRTFADALGVMLCEANIPSTTIHGERDQAQREEAIREFHNGRKAVLIATGVAERGLDICGVDHVINYDLPNDIDTYVHRIGRTGRVGNPGRATAFFSAFDHGLAEGLIRVLEEAKQDVPAFLRMLGGNAPSFPAPEHVEEQW